MRFGLYIWSSSVDETEKMVSFHEIDENNREGKMITNGTGTSIKAALEKAIIKLADYIRNQEKLKKREELKKERKERFEEEEDLLSRIG